MGVQITFASGVDLYQFSAPNQRNRTRNLSFRLSIKGEFTEEAHNGITRVYFSSRTRLEYEFAQSRVWDALSFSNRLKTVALEPFMTYNKDRYAIPVEIAGASASFVGWSLLDNLSGTTFRALTDLKYTRPDNPLYSVDDMNAGLVPTYETVTWQKVG